MKKWITDHIPLTIALLLVSMVGVALAADYAADQKSDGIVAHGGSVSSTTRIMIQDPVDTDIITYQTNQEAVTAVLGVTHDTSAELDALYEAADATIIKQADVDDTPDNGDTTTPPSENWAFDHANDANQHPEYMTPAEHTTAVGAAYDTEAELDALFAAYESATSNDFDPDRLAGDTTDDDKVDQDIIEGFGGSATPKATLNDTDGADCYWDTNAADADDAVASFGCDDSVGDDQSYIELDGVNERVEIKKELLILSSNADPSAAGQIRHDSTVTNYTNGALRFYDGTNIRHVLSMVAATAEGCTDDQVAAYDAAADLWYCKDDAGSAGGDSVSIDSVAVVDPDFQDGGDINFTDTSNVVTATLKDDVVAAAEMADADHGDVAWSSGVASVEGGNIALDDNDAIEILGDADGMVDDSFNGVTITGRNAGEALTQWDTVRIANDTDPWHQADADAAGEFPAHGIVVATTADTNEAEVLVRGVVRNDAWTWTTGAAIYLGDTAGGLTSTAPSTSGDCVQIVGWALSDDEVYFDLSRPYLKAE